MLGRLYLKSPESFGLFDGVVAKQRDRWGLLLGPLRAAVGEARG